MGQFTERYEKLQTWAVLPAEPLTPDNDTERLETAPTASPADLGDASASVSVTLTPVPPAQAGDEDARA
jgi:hypothetical protein